MKRPLIVSLFDGDELPLDKAEIKMVEVVVG